MTVVPYDRALAHDIRRTPAPQFSADWLLDPAEIARRIGGTDFVPKAIRNNPAAITAALLYGAEVGLGPMRSLAYVSVIDGRPSMAAEGQRALILADGHELVIEESTNTRCTIAGRRRDSDAVSRVTWTLDDAKRARIAGKPNWQAYPRQMLLARASAELARAVFADVIAGMAATEEITDVDDDDAPSPSSSSTPEPAPTRRRKRTSVTAASPAAPEPAPDEPGAAADTPQPAEPNADEPAPPDPPTKDALARMFAGIHEHGLVERADRLAYCERVLDRKISSSKELSGLDVSRIIEALEGANPGFAERPAGTLAPSEMIPVGTEHAGLPENEQAVIAELEQHATREPGGGHERPPLPDDK